MKKVLQDTKVYFNGISQTVRAGVLYKDDAPIVLANKEKFVSVEQTKEVKTEAKEKKKEPKKVVKKVSKKEVEKPKEELLVEAPVAVLEATEEVVKEPTRRGRKAKN